MSLMNVTYCCNVLLHFVIENQFVIHLITVFVSFVVRVSVGKFVLSPPRVMRLEA